MAETDIPGSSSTLDHLKWLEKTFFDAVDVYGLRLLLLQEAEKIAHKKEKLTLEDLARVDHEARRHFENIQSNVSLNIIRAFVLGVLVLEAERKGYNPDATISRASIEQMAPSVADAARKFNLTLKETDALEFIHLRGVRKIQDISQESATMVTDALLEGIAQNVLPTEIAKQLERTFRDDDAEFNRNWRRVAIYETNSAFNNALLTRLGGKWAMWFALPGACKFCEAHAGKVFPVINPKASMDISGGEAGSQNYFDKLWLWKNAVWVGKDNVGKSRSGRQRTAEGLVDRPESDTWKPSIPAHPECRCRWVELEPTRMFVAKGQKLVPKSFDEKAWQEWYERSIAPTEEHLGKIHEVSFAA